MEEEQKKRHHDADKKRVLREGTATEVLKYQGELTNQELQNAVNRLNLESSLRGLSQREMKSAMDKVDGIMKTIKTGTEWAKIELTPIILLQLFIMLLRRVRVNR